MTNVMRRLESDPCTVFWHQTCYKEVTPIEKYTLLEHHMKLLMEHFKGHGWDKEDGPWVYQHDLNYDTAKLLGDSYEWWSNRPGAIKDSLPDNHP